jgi:hypothetical protein
VSKAIAAADADPDSKAQAGVLAEKVAAIKATQERVVSQFEIEPLIRRLS